jgi:hypothetical protein
MSKITDLFAKPKPKSDEFDSQFKFILDLKLDSQEMYNKVKIHYYSKLNQVL